MNGLRWTDILIALVAVYAAGLSTFNFIVEYRDKRRRITVELSIALVGQEADPLPSFMLLIEAANPRYRAVTLNAPTILLPDKRTYALLRPRSNVDFPHALQHGQKCTAWTPARDFAKQVQREGYHGKIKIKAGYRDQLGTLYKSKAVSFDIEDWLASQ